MFWFLVLPQAAFWDSLSCRANQKTKTKNNQNQKQPKPKNKHKKKIARSLDLPKRFGVLVFVFLGVWLLDFLVSV